MPSVRPVLPTGSPCPCSLRQELFFPGPVNLSRSLSEDQESATGYIMLRKLEPKWKSCPKPRKSASAGSRGGIWSRVGVHHRHGSVQALAAAEIHGSAKWLQRQSRYRRLQPHAAHAQVAGKRAAPHDLPGEDPRRSRTVAKRSGNARSSVESSGSLVTHSTTPFSAWKPNRKTIV